MEAWIWILVGITIVIVVAILMLAIELPRRRARDAARMRREFGPEYERTVEEMGSEREALAELQRRRKRVEKLHLRPISADQKKHLQNEWMSNQAEFVDSPEGAFDRAADLVDEAMKARGYPVADDFDRRYADLSVEHGYVLNNYRDGREVAVARNRGEDVETEDLRRAMVCYRALFNELLANRASETERGKEPRERHRAAS
jgi:hypothetical protein